MELSRMSLQEKVGQMFICGFQGQQPDEHVERLIRNQRIGGVIYFSRNVTHPKQVYSLSTSLQQIAVESGEIPLLVAIDQEGGMVTRITHGVTPLPGNMALGAVRDMEGVCQLAKISGKELRLLGINTNLAPCLDIQSNPHNPVIGVRSYGADPELVAALGVAAMRGFAASNVAAVLKHFPGHGDTVSDSHLALPVIEHRFAALRQRELAPFVYAIQQGAQAIMTAHVLFKSIDPDLPATLSKKVLTGLLREQLGFAGVIMTDCMEMKAIADTYGTAKAAVMAVQAGADLILISHTEDTQVRAIEAVMEAVNSGMIPIECIDRAVARIMRTKQNYAHPEEKTDWSDIQQKLATPESVALATELSGRSVTVVRDDAGQIPLSQAKKMLVVYPKIAVTTGADERVQVAGTLGEELAQRGYSVTERLVGTNPEPLEIEGVLQASGGFDRILVATYNTAAYPAQGAMINQLIEQHGAHKIVVVSLRNPYDLMSFPNVSTYAAAYETTPLAVRSLADVLSGKRVAEGVLPVRLFPT